MGTTSTTSVDPVAAIADACEKNGVWLHVDAAYAGSAMVCPELNLVHQGLAREDLFLCVHEQFLTETAAFADVVLPATMFVEHDDFYTASGHTYFQVAKKVIDFRQDIYPLLTAHCFKCHQGADAKAGYRLDLRAEILGETNGKPLVRVGGAKQSHPGGVHEDQFVVGHDEDGLG